MLKKDAVKLKHVRMKELKDIYEKLNKEDDSDFHNIHTYVKTVHNIATTFMNNNTTAAWLDWLNHSSVERLQSAADTMMDSNTEVTRITKLTRELFAQQLLPINNLVEKLNAVDEEICSVMMYSM